MSATLAELAIHCDAELRGDPTLQIDRVASLESAGPRDIAFVAGEKYSAQLARTLAGAVILAVKDANRFSGNALLNNNPRLCLAKVAALFHPPAPIPAGRHATAELDAFAVVAAEVAIGAQTVVEAGANIGIGVVIGPGCYIGAGATIGSDTRLHAHVTLAEGCVLGDVVSFSLAL